MQARNEKNQRFIETGPGRIGPMRHECCLPIFVAHSEPPKRLHRHLRFFSFSRSSTAMLIVKTPVRRVGSGIGA